jgi:hypothetical protein
MCWHFLWLLGPPPPSSIVRKVITMETIRQSILTGTKSRKSTCSIIENDLDSIRATVLGKFYEGIIAEWLHRNKGFEHLKGKPCVYWQDVEIPDIETFREHRTSLQNLQRTKKRTNSDGLFRTDHQEHYLWEAKNWPKWNEGLTDKAQISNVFKTTPWVFARQVRHGGKDKQISGVLFSWWKRFDGFEDFEKDVMAMTGSKFKFYFTSDVIDDCRKEQYDWYIKLIREQQRNISDFFGELLAL